MRSSADGRQGFLDVNAIQTGEAVTTGGKKQKQELDIILH